MRKFLSVILLTTLVACSNSSKQSIDSDLPVIDLEKEYPVKRIDIHEIADVDYIPLETTDESVLSVGATKIMSEKYIIVAENTLGLYYLNVFDRQGKYIRSIDRQGEGPEEYPNFINFIADFDTNELFIRIGNKTDIKVYTLNGQFLRKFKLPTTEEVHHYSFENLYNYDKNYLIAYNDMYWPSLKKEYYRDVDKTPFYLINKKDGSIKSIDGRLTVDNPVVPFFQMGQDMSGRYVIRQGYNFFHLLMNGTSEALLLENSLDTIYTYKNHVLEPVMIRIPQTASMNPKCFIAPCVFTDKYFIYRKVTMIRDEEKEKKELVPYDTRTCPAFIMYRETGEIFQMELYDSNFNKEVRLDNKLLTGFPGNGLFFSSTERNQISGHHNASYLLENFDTSTFKGKLKEAVSKMTEEDNPLTVIYTFR